MSSLPADTVTFLFTDIEGSTKGWEASPEAMSTALARHDAILRAAIDTHGGHVFKTVGDAFCAVFAQASDAASAAVDAQCTLAAEDWSAFGSGLPDLRVRMAIHTGEAESRDDDDFGPTLNRVARLMAAGYGQQVLLSTVTEGLVAGRLPAGVCPRDLGVHRLKDLDRPERVFQLVAPGLPADFPSLKTLDARPNNLPFERTPLIGREAEVRHAAETLARPDTAVVTLTGPGGTGKTRLALQVAAEVIDDFPDGVFFVALAAITDPTLVVPTVAETLGLQENPPQLVDDTLQDHLRERCLLLVLDNFEQVVDAAPAVGRILDAAPGVKALVTSRVALRLRAERELPVEPLPVPDPRRLPEPDQLTRFAAVELFVQRAQAVKPEFSVSSENAPAIAGICARLDGLPLAIELAAARIRILPPARLLTRLDSRLKLLVGGARDLPERQQTLRGAIAWSYDLLPAEQQVLFRWLGVFKGGWTLEAAEAVCAQGEELTVLDGLDALCTGHLLRSVETAAGDARYDMLETIREFSVEALDASGETDALCDRHAEWFAELAEEFETEAYSTGDEAHWLPRMEAERNNLRAAIDRAVSASGRADLAARLGMNLYRHWLGSGRFTEGAANLGRIRATCADSPAGIRGRLEQAEGDMHLFAGKHEAAEPLLNRAATGLRTAGDELYLSWALNGLGNLSLYRADLAATREHYEESLALKRRAGEPWDVAIAVGNLGEVAHLQGDLDCAEALYREAISTLEGIGVQVMVLGEYLKDLGNLMRQRGRPDEAGHHLRRGLGVVHAMGSRVVAAKILAGLGGLAVDARDPLRAASLFAATGRLLAEAGGQLEPLDAAPFDRHLAAVRAALPPESVAAAWTEGQAKSFDEVVAHADGEEQGSVGDRTGVAGD